MENGGDDRDSFFSCRCSARDVMSLPHNTMCLRNLTLAGVMSMCVCDSGGGGKEAIKPVVEVGGGGDGCHRLTTHPSSEMLPML